MDLTWDPQWRRQRPVRLAEPVGLARDRELVTLPIDVASQTPEEFVRSLRVVVRDPRTRRFAEAPSQAVRVRPGVNGLRADVVFFASLPARGEADVLMCYDNPSAEQPRYASDLDVALPNDDGLGWTFQTAAMRASLDPRSGQLATFDPADRTYPYRAEPVHWNPDVVPAPPRQEYYNVRRWSPPPGVSIEIGPLITLVERSGPLAFAAAADKADDRGVPEIEVAVGYEFGAWQRHVIQTSAITAVDDVLLHALRNGGELTYGQEAFTDAAWSDASGRVNGIPLGGMAARAIDDRRGGLVARDARWFAFVDRRSRTGMAVIFLKAANVNYRLTSGRAPVHNEGLYVFSALEGDFFFRAPVWEYALYDRPNAPAVAIPAGSCYAERNAWLPFKFGEDMFDEVRSTEARLRNPLVATYELREERSLRNLPEPGPEPQPYP